jgi:hypothetical protein
MNAEKKELLDNFLRLDPENRANMLAHIRVAVVAQETTKKAMKAPVHGPRMGAKDRIDQRFFIEEVKR